MKRYFKKPLAFVMAAAITAGMIPNAFAKYDKYENKLLAHSLYAANVKVSKLGDVSYTTKCAIKGHEKETFPNDEYANEANVTVTKTVVPPTCTKNGYYYYVVSIYGDVVEGNPETFELTDAQYKATGHTPSGNYVYKHSTATCENGGTADRYDVCATCGELYNKTTVGVEALGHDFELDYTDELGNQFFKCARVGCNETKKVLYNHTHIKGNWVLDFSKTVVPTCTTDGSFTYNAYCTVCGVPVDTKTEVWKSKGHEFMSHYIGINKKAYVAPTCTSKGSYEEIRHCDICGKEYAKTIELDKIPHTYQTKEISNTATCTNAGIKTTQDVCAVCGDVKANSTKETFQPALGHKIKVTKENEVAPTCIKEGYYQKVQTCERENCGVELSRELVLVPATNQHTYTHKLVWVDADNKLLGDKEVITKDAAPKFVYADVCDVCGKVKAITAEIQATPDPYKTVDSEGCKVGSKTFTATITFKDNKTGKTETVTETKTFPYAKDGKLEKHTVVTNTSVTKPATCTEEGVKTTVTKCSVCGEILDESKTETIEKKPHNYVDGVCTECNAKDPNYVEPKPITIDATKIKSVSTTKTTATVKVVSIKGATGYQYKIWQKGNTAGATYAKANSTTKKFTGLNKNKTYGVKVRSYIKVGGNYTYSDWTAIQYVKTKK